MALTTASWWHCQQHTSSDRTPLARMLPRVIGGPAWDRGVLMPGRIFAPAVPRQVPAGARYCATRCRTRAKDDRRLALERAKRQDRRPSIDHPALTG
jgi:hypothetical protein